MRQSWNVATLALLLGAALSPAVRGDYESAVLAKNPLGYYRLGESGGGAALDASGFGRDGVYSGGAALGTPGAIVGDADAAVTLDGVDGQVQIAGGPFNLQSGFTLEAWVINDNATGTQRVVSNGGVSGGTGYGYGLIDGRLLFTTYGIRDYVSSVLLPADGRYHHYVVTFDDSATASFYLNGALVDTLSGFAPADLTVSDLYIGQLGHGIEHWSGAIDEVAVYGRVLSDGQIAENYQAGVVPEPSSLLLSGLGLIGGLLTRTRLRRG